MTAAPAARSWSLRHTLLAVLLGLTCAVWAGSAFTVYLEADRESQELFDQSLTETAHLLLTLAEHEVEERQGVDSTALDEHDDLMHGEYLIFQLWDKDGHLLYKSAAAPEQPFAQADGLGWTSIDQRRWRTYASWDGKGQLQIQLAEPASHRQEISDKFAHRIAGYALLAVPLLAGAIWWSINRVFRALQRSAGEVAQRTPNELREVSVDGAPTEVQPLLRAINQLFGRVRLTLEHEQRFTADAAHELRTPLAAIKTNLQVIQRARNDAERNEFLAGLGASVDRASRLVDQLMTLSRLEPQTGAHPALQSLDLCELLAAQVPALREQARRHGLQLETALSPARCMLDPDSLQILLRNLCDNAMRYTPQPGVVRLSCRREGEHVCLEVADTGPGIPAAMRERVFDRFFRLADANQPGSGLGLSIVRRVADAHGATVELGDGLDGRGLGVRVLFPASAAG